MKEGLESLGRIRLAGFVLLAVTFGVGVLAGAAGERMRARHLAPEAWRPPGERMRGGPYDWLDLTQDQRSRIAEIMERARPLTDSVLQETMPQLRAIMDSTHQAVRAVLTPEQRERLDKRFPEGFPARPPFDRGPERPPPGAPNRPQGPPGEPGSAPRLDAPGQL